MIALYILLGIILLLIILYICFYKQINIFIVAVTGIKRIQRNLYKACKANDFLILNDVWVPISTNKYKHIDTIIFGNKYVYITKEIKQLGEVKVSLNDQKWRVIYHGALTLIDNPFNYNKKIINNLLEVVEGLEEKDLKSLVVLSKTCKFNALNNSNNEFIVSEKDVIKLIHEIEDNSDDDIIDPYDAERYATAFYNYGIEAEKEIKSYKRR